MKSRRQKNQRLTSERERRKKFYVEGVVKRGSTAAGVKTRRWSLAVFRWAAWTTLAAAVVVGGVIGWQRLFWNNPDYALKHVHVVTGGSLTREQAIKAANLQPGRNIYSYKIGAARETLRKLPQVASVEVTRYFPNRIEVNVVERKPVAWVSSKATETEAKSDRAYLMDEQGIVFQPKRTLNEYGPMPVIGGVEMEDIELGNPIRKAEIVAALDVLRRVRDSGNFKVMSIDVTKGYSFVVTNQRKSQFTFGLDDIPEQLNRLDTVQTEAAQIGQDIATANLIPKRNIPVTFMVPAPPEPPDSDTPEPARSPKTRETSAAKTGGAKPASITPSREKSPPPKPAKTTPPKPTPAPVIKKSSPPKPKATPPDDGNSVLKRFHV